MSLPEDHVKSTPDVSYFLFFLGLPSEILCATGLFFLKIFESIFTQLRPGHRPHLFVFLNKKWGKVQKVEFWCQCPGLDFVKMDPKIFKIINHVHSIRPRKK